MMARALVEKLYKGKATCPRAPCRRWCFLPRSLARSLAPSLSDLSLSRSPGAGSPSLPSSIPPSCIHMYMNRWISVGMRACHKYCIYACFTHTHTGFTRFSSMSCVLGILLGFIPCSHTLQHFLPLQVHLSYKASGTFFTDVKFCLNCGVSSL